MLDLKTGDRGHAAQFGDGRGPRHPPGRKVGKTGVEDLSGSNEIVEAAHDFFEGRYAIRHVRPVKIDPVGPEPLETRLDRRDHGPAAIAGDKDAGLGVRLKGEFRRQHKIVAASGQELSQNLLGLTELIAIGRIDEVSARVRIGVEDPAGLIGLRAMSPTRAESAGAEDEFGDPQSRVFAEKLVSHGLLFRCSHIKSNRRSAQGAQAERRY
jgi:hypothetical protein